jgi:hypothetical protein
LKNELALVKKGLILPLTRGTNNTPNNLICYLLIVCHFPQRFPALDHTVYHVWPGGSRDFVWRRVWIWCQEPDHVFLSKTISNPSGFHTHERQTVPGDATEDASNSSPAATSERVSPIAPVQVCAQAMDHRMERAKSWRHGRVEQVHVWC